MKITKGKISIIIIFISISFICIQNSTKGDEYNADINHDGKVDILDLIYVVNNIGRTGDDGFIPEDVNKDGIVDVMDLIEISNEWGGVTPFPRLLVVEPFNNKISIGDTFTINITVYQAKNIEYISTNLNFNPHHFRVIDVYSGNFSKEENNFTYGEIDNQRGIIINISGNAWGIDTSLNSSLAIIKLKNIGIDESETYFELSNITMYDINNKPVNVIPIKGLIIVKEKRPILSVELALGIISVTLTIVSLLLAILWRKEKKRNR